MNFVNNKSEITSIKRNNISLQERLKLYEQALPLRTPADLKEDEDWFSSKPEGKEVL